MDIKELTIGDYVSLFQGNKDGSNCIAKVESLNANGEIGLEGCDEWDGALSALIFPIPLSVEILESNGFKLVGDHTSHWQICGKGYDDIQISGVPDPKHHVTLTLNAYKNSTTGVGYGCYRMISDMTIRYVHELQHIMRICKIGKEIVL